MFGQVGGRLPGQRGVGRPAPLAPFTVAARAGRQPATAIAGMIERGSAYRQRGGRLERQAGVMTGYLHPLGRFEFPGDPLHLRVMTAPVGIRLHLPAQVPRIQPREARRACTVAASIQPVAGEARIGGTCPRPAQRDQLAVLRKAIDRGRLCRRAARQQGDNGEMGKRPGGHRFEATARRGMRFHYLLVPVLLAACKPPPDERQLMPGANAANGLATMKRVGCGSCHAVPGLHWPRGKVGPTLEGLAERALLAGTLPNRPDTLSAYIRNAPKLVPGSAMPAMPVSEAEARDIAAFLYQQGAR